MDKVCTRKDEKTQDNSLRYWPSGKKVNKARAKRTGAKVVGERKPSFWLNKSCTPLNEYKWQQSLSLFNFGSFRIVTLTSGKVNTMPLNKIDSNWVWKVMLLCFGFAFLRNMIGVELKLTLYFESARLKSKSNRDLGLLRFSRLGQITCFYSSSCLCSFDFPLILVLQHLTEMPSKRKPSSLGIFEK